jgi:transketolase
MRSLLSDKIVSSAIEDPRFVVLSGDHGYALFDGIRKAKPDQFINVGVAEQAMVGYSAGLAKTGFRPLVYGLAAFIPVRVLEQIKMDICYSSLPVIFLGDGAGLVYSTLGSSHQCAEDIACLRPLPNLTIYSPCDANELAVCFDEARSLDTPSYIRIGKSDRPVVNTASLKNTHAHIVHEGTNSNICVIASGSMVAIAKEAASDLGVSVISVPKIKPFPDELLALAKTYSTWIVMEEHSRYGGLFSSIAERTSETKAGHRAQLISFSLQEKFAERCGSYQYALSEHDLSDVNIKRRLQQVIKENT